MKDANDKYFDIVVWKDENGRPGEEVYRLEGQRPIWQEMPYQFSYYRFTKPVLLSGAFYMGIEQRSDDLINIGFDASVDNIQYNFINTNGAWQQSSKHGSLMIRPVVGSSYYIGVDENGTSTGSGAFVLYPNPASSTLHLDGDIQDGQVCIYDLTGRRVFEGEYQSEIPVSQLNDGMYFLSITTTEGQVFTQKFIIKK